MKGGGGRGEHSYIECMGRGRYVGPTKRDVKQAWTHKSRFGKFAIIGLLFAYVGQREPNKSRSHDHVPIFVDRVAIQTAFDHGFVRDYTDII